MSIGLQFIHLEGFFCCDFSELLYMIFVAFYNQTSQLFFFQLEFYSIFIIKLNDASIELHVAHFISHFQGF